MKASNIQLIETSDNQVIEIECLWVNDNPFDPQTDTLALICHPNPLHGGTMHNKVVTTMWRFSRDENYHVIRFNFRGVGKSTGEHDYAKGEIVDAITVLQWAQDQTNVTNLWLGGFSFGGYVAARVAEQIEYYSHIWGLDFKLQTLALIAPSVVNNNTSDLRLPKEVAFQIHGNADEVVCPDAMYSFAQRMNVELVAIPEVGHFFHGNLHTLKQKIQELSRR